LTGDRRAALALTGYCANLRLDRDKPAGDPVGINPDKLHHIGPVADAWALMRESRDQSQ
jgi:hypothetical protein